MIRYFYKSAKDKTLKTLDQFKGGSWVYVEDPTEKELAFLTGKFGLEEGLLRDAIDENEVPRLEIEDKVIYIYIRFAHIEKEVIVTHPVLIALGSNFIATIGKDTDFILDTLQKRKNGFTTSKRASILLTLLTIINTSFQTYLRDINKMVRTSSIKLEKIQNRDIVRFVTYENVLNDFLSALVPTNGIFNHLLSGKIIELEDQYHDIVEDLKLSNNEIIETSKSTLRTMVNVREAYSTIVTNNLNVVIKLLTSLTVLLAIPTMIASFFGMNVPLDFAQHPLAFFGIILGSVFISVILVLVFIKRDWI
jgi:magnesium transporter